MEEKLTMTVREMAKELGISEPLAYELTEREGFPVIKVGKRRKVIPVDGFKRWLSEAGKKEY